MIKRYTIAILALPLVGTLATEAGAQLADPSARSLGLSGAYTARARGYEAVFWNPANLGLPGHAGWSVGLPAVNAFVANNSLSYGDITGLYGEYLDDQRKSEILEDIRRGDPERMLNIDGDASAHWVGFSIWRFAVGGGSIATGTAELSADAVELILFGNVGEDGLGKDFALEGSNALGWSVSAVGASYAQPFTIPALDHLGMHFSVGATAKYLVAHGLGRVTDQGSLFTQDPLAVDVSAEAIYSSDAISGSGWSVDLALAMKSQSVTAGLTVRNLAGNIAWDEDVFELTVVTASADFSSSTSSDTTFTFDELSPDDQARVQAFLDEASLPTRIRLGGKFDLGPKFSVSGDYEETVGGTLRAGWERLIATGAELALVPNIPLRIGLGTNFEDIAYAGGLGIYGGPVHFDIAARHQSGGLALAISLSVWPGTQN